MAAPKGSLGRACDSFEPNLVLYHYGELAGAENDVVKSHIAACADCAGYLASLGELLPRTIKSDAPPEEFWHDYSRELRLKLDAVEARRWSWLSWPVISQPRHLAAVFGAAVVALALAFTLGKSLWGPNNVVQDDDLAAPLRENLEFFSTMEVLDNLDLLEFMASDGDTAA